MTGRKSSLQNDWLIFHKGVGGRYLFFVARIFFQALFSQILIFACRGHFQELQLNNNLADFSKIWPDARKIYNQQKGVGEFDNSKNSLLEGHFGAFTPHSFLAVLNMFCNF